MHGYSQLERICLSQNDWFFSLHSVIILFNLRGTMCTPSCGQNDIFPFLDRANHITTCLPQDHFNVFHPLQVPTLL